MGSTCSMLRHRHLMPLSPRTLEMMLERTPPADGTGYVLSNDTVSTNPVSVSDTRSAA